MGEDATLDEFVDPGGSGADEDESDREGAGGGDPDTDGTSPATDDGATGPTSRWAPEGAACDGCGGAADRLWRQGDELVCPACKDWTEP